MTYRGHIKNGVAVLDAQIKLPDGTPVQVDIQPSDSDFWRGKNVEETAQEQSVHPVADLDQLAGDWPENETVDDFLALIRRNRA